MTIKKYRFTAELEFVFDKDEDGNKVVEYMKQHGWVLKHLGTRFSTKPFMIFVQGFSNPDAMTIEIKNVYKDFKR